MRKIDPPIIQDQLLLGFLQYSSKADAKAMKHRIPDIALRYDAYALCNGDPWNIAEDASYTPLKVVLNDLYKHPPSILSFIPSLRSGLDGACPVCGRDALGTLDHYLPKANYSEFSFYSINLIPACDRCNNKRSNSFKGGNVGERPMHPYFDYFANGKILSVRFEPDWTAPRLTPIPYNVTGKELTVVQWHIDNVLRRAGVDEYLTTMWGVLVNDVRTFLPDRSSLVTIKAEIHRYEMYEFKCGKSANGWRCAFWHGLNINDDALLFLQAL
ncbi:hypothetical protein M5G27_19690 [Pseudomonas shahriarae]|uniref:HNH endonuclease n=1 Tax=Pseudomonas shahriarae TaxID=2745512 RepID=A0A9X4C3Q1_9PSED|nr:hypothetical protein [Pseudomonas shahriarae]MDD1009704.1 hypothetical protein [Pseudomonas shahriarae]